MAITNYDSIISARSSGHYEDPFYIKGETFTPLAAGNWISLLNMGGTPSSINVSLTSAAGGVALCSTHEGAMQLTTNSTNFNRYLLSAGAGQQGVASLGCAWLLDVLWGISGIPYTGATFEINSTALTRSTDGLGNRIMCVQQTNNATNANTTATITYTNSNGTTGRTSTGIVMTTASRAHHCRPVGQPFCYLQDGDNGVRSVEKISFNATIASGLCQIYIVKPLLIVPLLGSGMYTERDQTLQIEGMIKLSEGTDGKLPYLGWIASGTAAVANTVFYSQIKTVYG
jgi:hypothetical protein